MCYSLLLALGDGMTRTWSVILSTFCYMFFLQSVIYSVYILSYILSFIYIMSYILSYILSFIYIMSYILSYILSFIYILSDIFSYILSYILSYVLSTFCHKFSFESVIRSVYIQSYVLSTFCHKFSFQSVIRSVYIQSYVLSTFCYTFCLGLKSSDDQLEMTSYQLFQIKAWADQTMLSRELVWTGQPVKPCRTGSWFELINQLPVYKSWAVFQQGSPLNSEISVLSTFHFLFY